MRILFYEFKKILFKQKAIIFILLFILLKLMVLYSTNSYSVETTEQNKAFYKQYLMEVTGELTPEKEAFIKNEENRINELNFEEIDIVDKYLSEKIEDSEFTLKINEINSSLKKSDAFKIINDQYKYVKQSPENRYFLYTNGWTNLLAPERLDMLLIFLLLIVITPIFTYEYEKDMVSLLLTSKKGKLIIPAYKIGAASIITILLTMSFSLIEYIYCKVKYGLPSGDFPLQSISFFKTSTQGLSLMQTYLCISLIKVIGFLVFTYLIIFIATITKKTVLTLFTSLSFILIPYFIYFNDSVKYKLPLPLGFMIGNGYFRGTDNSKNLAKGASNFLEISKVAFKLQSLYMIILLVVFIIGAVCIFSRFKYKRREKI